MPEHCSATSSEKSNQAHVAALSGGADSTAMALAMHERGMQVDHYFCSPTGDEGPDMLAHWDILDAMLSRPLTRLGANLGLVPMSRKLGILPNVKRRWCTRKLKVEPCLVFLTKLALSGSPPVLYVGLRADEETREGLYSEKVVTRCPLREWGWTRSDVLAFLDDRGVKIPRRTDCLKCPEQQLSEWWWLWRKHPESWAEGEALESFVSEHHGKLYTIRSPTRDTWPAGLRELRERFEAGWVPTPRKLQERLFGESDDGATSCRVCRL